LSETDACFESIVSFHSYLGIFRVGKSCSLGGYEFVSRHISSTTWKSPCVFF